MPGKRIFLALVILSFSLTARANYDFNSRCMQAYRAIFDFRLNDARGIIDQEKTQNPQNGITILLDNYVDFISLLTSDNKKDYEKLSDNKGERLDALEANEENSPWYLYAQADVYLQWGLIKGKFGDYTSSGLDLKKAKNLLNENAEKYPDFLPNQKSLALIDVVFGALPTNLKGVAKFLGMQGNIQNGIASLEKVHNQMPTSKYGFLKNEVVFYLCYMDIVVLHNTTNYVKLSSYIDDLDNKSLLRSYLQGFVAAKTGHNDDAIENLMAITKTKQYAVLPVVDYLLGVAKLCRNDTDAYIYLLRYINQYKGINYIKDAYLKVGYYYYFRGDNSKFDYYLNLVRTKGYKVDEKDQQALKEANDTKPNIDLLRARFNFDGGYYDKALALLINKRDSDFILLRDKIEWHYRLGRIYEKTKKFNEAITSYQKAINLGRAQTWYYAGNAALGIAGIYEYIKDYGQAANYYKQALAMRNHEYQNSIDTQAKEGLERIHR